MIPVSPVSLHLLEYSRSEGLHGKGQRFLDSTRKQQVSGSAASRQGDASPPVFMSTVRPELRRESLWASHHCPRGSLYVLLEMLPQPNGTGVQAVEGVVKPLIMS